MIQPIMQRLAAEDDIVENGGASTLAKRQKPAAATDAASSGAAGAICDDDTVGSILARLPARAAIRCTALSKHHRGLIRSPSFRSLHCRLGAPLPSPHVAYLATAPIRQASGYYGFHLAGAGLTSTGDAPIRSVAGSRYLRTKYVNTCNGVLLIATNGFSGQCRCILWNPAIADVAREVTIPRPSPEKNKSEPFVLPNGTEVELQYKETHFLPVGLGYGRRSNTYKLLLCRRNRSLIHRLIHIPGAPAAYHFEYSLLVRSLGGANKETQLRTVSFKETLQLCSSEVDKEIFQNKSLYMDGKIYFLHLKKHVIFAFDVDDETVRTTDMLGERHRAYMRHLDLIEMSGRPCLVITQKDCITMWQLTANYQLEPIHVLSYKEVSDHLYDHTIVGIWDCGSILFLWLVARWTDKLLLYHVTEKKICRAYLPRDLAVNKDNYMLCWGYKPTLVSPESIVGEFDQDMERRRDRSAHITEVINPLHLQDRRKGKEATLNIVCLMEFLVRIMQKLPHDLQDVVAMLKMDSEEPGSLFQCLIFRSIDT